MKKIIAPILLAALLISLCACGGQEPTPTESTKAAVNFNYPQINEKLTWDAINAFPIKTEDMTEDEMRDLCVDFFYFSKTFLWIPGENWNYIIETSDRPDEMIMGTVYGGLPYITSGTGNVYRYMDIIDVETGVADMTEPIANPKLFGNQCSYGTYWGWSRVVNSANFGFTRYMTQKNGFLRVGPYTYDDKLDRFDADTYRTSDVIKENGSDIMCQSYAAMKRADGVITYTTAGHVMMICTDPVVVYDASGNIDPAQSYVYILDQHSGWVEGTNDSGDTYQYKKNVNRKFTFMELMEDAYIPFTFAEFLGTDPVEPTEYTFSHTGETITPAQLNAGEFTANYGVSDMYALVKDSNGNVVYTVTSRNSTLGNTLNFFKLVTSEDMAPYTDGNHTVEVVCQLSTGERPTVYTGKLVK